MRSLQADDSRMKGEQQFANSICRFPDYAPIVFKIIPFGLKYIIFLNIKGWEVYFLIKSTTKWF